MNAMLKSLPIEHPSSSVVNETRYNSMSDCIIDANVTRKSLYASSVPSIPKSGTTECDKTVVSGIMAIRMTKIEKSVVIKYIVTITGRFFVV